MEIGAPKAKRPAVSVMPEITAVANRDCTYRPVFDGDDDTIACTSGELATLSSGVPLVLGWADDVLQDGRPFFVEFWEYEGVSSLKMRLLAPRPSDELVMTTTKAKGLH